jgi:hypothetical protein
MDNQLNYRLPQGTSDVHIEHNLLDSVVNIKGIPLEKYLKVFSANTYCNTKERLNELEQERSSDL